MTLIDLPLSVSPVISGMMFVLLFGARAVSSTPGFAARVIRVHAVGPRVRVELIRLDGAGALEAELPRGEIDALSPRVGDELFAIPRHVRVFAEGGRWRWPGVLSAKMGMS